MKNRISTFLIGLIVLLSSCEKYLDVNTDPNNPAKAPYDLVMPAASLSAASVYGGDLIILGSIWAQHFTQSNVANQYKNIDSYNLISQNFNAMFNECYAGALNDLRFILKESEMAKDWNTYLMATVTECFMLQVMVDLYDQIPYNEAFLGEKNLMPHYDNGMAIYDTLINKINRALVKDFSAKTNTDLAEKDLIFGGKMARWKEFANTLKLKIYLRQTKVASRATLVNAGLTECLAAPLLATDAKITGFTTAIGKQNPYYGADVDPNGLGGINLKASQTLYNYLVNKGDARRTLIYRPGSAAGTTYNALQQGNYNAPATGSTANNMLATGRFSATDPVYFISLAESKFMQAEAKVRLSLTGAQADYEDGVTASYTKFGIAASAPGALAGSYAFPTDSTSAVKIREIITQKWIASVMSQPIEAFFDFNRTGYPTVFVTSVESVLLPGKFPQRLLFPKSEVDRNPNTPTQVAVDVPVWWAQ